MTYEINFKAATFCDTVLDEKVSPGWISRSTGEIGSLLDFGGRPPNLEECGSSGRDWFLDSALYHHPLLASAPPESWPPRKGTTFPPGLPKSSVSSIKESWRREEGRVSWKAIWPASALMSQMCGHPSRT